MKYLFCICMLIAMYPAAAQNYHAVQGSSYAGGLGIANNPSSMQATPYRWDLSLIGAQFKASTNIFTVYNFSVLSPSPNSLYSINGGDFGRKGKMSYNLNILNGRIALSRKESIGFGVNFRGYAKVKTDPYNYIDTINGIRDFLDLNESNRSLKGSLIGSSWIEIFGSYSRTIWDNSSTRLNAGISLKASRGISGAFMNASNIRFQRQSAGNQQYYLLRDGSLNYGYSSNYDRVNDSKSASQNTRDFISFTEGGLAFDIGVEYILKSQAVPTYNEDDYYDYEWKFGASLLDVGLNQYKYGNQSRTISGLRVNSTDTSLEEKFRSIESLAEANDSLSTVVNSYAALGGKFSIINPFRLVLNADRFLYDAFYINGEISLNLSSLAGNKYHYVEEMNLITITPRWETKRWGVYLPVQLNTEGKFWVGGAFKAGPLLFGVHNWANIFSKKKITQGGAYLAIVLRAKNNLEGRRDRRLNCP